MGDLAWLILCDVTIATLFVSRHSCRMMCACLCGPSSACGAVPHQLVRFLRQWFFLLPPPLHPLTDLCAVLFRRAPDGADIAVACGDGILRVCAVMDGTVEVELRGHMGAVLGCSWAGKHVATGGRDHTVRWNAPGARQVV